MRTRRSRAPADKSRECTVENAASTRSDLAPPKKKLRSQDPDVIVSVGRGNNKREFETYKLILSYSSEYFDTMLSLPLRETDTSRIELPDKDPDTWTMFYEFLDPATLKQAKITNENALTLAPWFNEYQMKDLHDQCDSISSTTAYFNSFLQVKDLGINNDSTGMTIWKLDGKYCSTDRTIKTIERLLEFYSTSDQCALKKSHKLALHEVGKVMCHAYDLLAEKPALMETLVEIYQQNKIQMKKSKLLDEKTLQFYTDIANHNEMDWNSALFKSWIQSKLENVVLKTRIFTLEQKLKKSTSLEQKLSNLPTIFNYSFGLKLSQSSWRSNYNNYDALNQEKSRIKALATDTLVKLL